MDFTLFSQQVANGLINGMNYVLISTGLTLVFGVLRVINFAHGEFYMLGAFLTFFAMKLLGLGYIPAALLATLVVGGLGVAVNNLFFWPLRKEHEFTVLLSSLGLPDDLLRWVGIGTLALVGIGLAMPAVGHLLERPFMNTRMPQLKRDGNGFLMGVALGLVFVPCAGPILASITVLAATKGLSSSRRALKSKSIPSDMFFLAGICTASTSLKRLSR